MSDSSSSGKFARDASKSTTTGPATPEEWPATRAEPRLAGRDRRVAGDANPGAPAERHRRMARPAAARRRHAAGIAAPCRPLRRRRRIARRLGSDARPDRAGDPVARGRDRLPRDREGRDRPPDRRQRARAVRLVRPGRGAAAAVRAPAAQLHRRPRHRHLVVAEAPDRHRRGERAGGAEAGRSGARATARRWRRSSSSSCRPPTTSCCASTRPRPTPTPRRATRSRASCSPTAGSASSWSASCPATRSRRR